MNRRSSLVLFASVLAVSACAPIASTTTSADAPAPRPVRTVYIGDLGRSADAEQARAAMRAELAERSQFVVVENERDADAVLRGLVVLRRRSERLEDARVLGHLQLVDANTGRLFWTHRYAERSMQTPMDQPTPRELLTRFARQMSEDLHRTAMAQAAAQN
jgi:hypothetical protein